MALGNIDPQNWLYLNLLIKLLRQLTKGNLPVGIFLDLSKAFDSINHKILISKLEHYGIRGVAKTWFENYLYKRRQILKYNCVQSEEMIIKSGVPQGSVLGPLLFLL